MEKTGLNKKLIIIAIVVVVMICGIVVAFFTYNKSIVGNKYISLGNKVDTVFFQDDGICTDNFSNPIAYEDKDGKIKILDEDNDVIFEFEQKGDYLLGEKANKVELEKKNDALSGTVELKNELGHNYNYEFQEGGTGYCSNFNYKSGRFGLMYFNYEVDGDLIKISVFDSDNDMDGKTYTIYFDGENFYDNVFTKNEKLV